MGWLDTGVDEGRVGNSYGKSKTVLHTRRLAIAHRNEGYPNESKIASSNRCAHHSLIYKTDLLELLICNSFNNSLSAAFLFNSCTNGQSPVYVLNLIHPTFIFNGRKYAIAEWIFGNTSLLCIRSKLSRIQADSDRVTSENIPEDGRKSLALRTRLS